MVNGQIFKDLYKMIGELKEVGMSVEYWHVDKQCVADAGRLANEALYRPHGAICGACRWHRSRTDRGVADGHSYTYVP